MNVSSSFRTVGIAVWLVLAFAACKKREAKLDLIGNWTVTGHTGYLYNECSGSKVHVDLDNAVLGSVTFESRWMKRTYSLREGEEACYPLGDVDDLVRWKVRDYEEQTSAAHEYTLHIDGQPWTLRFGDEGVGEYPNAQDLIYLYHVSGQGDDFGIELTRVETP